MPTVAERRALAYAKHFAPLFISRYIHAARTGHADIIPAQWRENVLCYVQGRIPSRAINLEDEVRTALFKHKMQTGNEPALPPDYSGGPARTPTAPMPTTTQVVLSAAAAGAKKAARGQGRKLAQIVLSSIFRR
ncbi:hypothetical protein [Bradyrhizobium stylosanthis]|uniref:hypothetical protein n=1 Tax=Bradyrhizobium stylosanthis TaxID=1803665 RepID=UPI0007C4D21F|nr:hypothetical protein [Bradyrhizobium stylosanthis]